MNTNKNISSLLFVARSDSSEENIFSFLNSPSGNIENVQVFVVNAENKYTIKEALERYLAKLENVYNVYFQSFLTFFHEFLEKRDDNSKFFLESYVKRASEYDDCKLFLLAYLFEEILLGVCVNNRLDEVLQKIAPVSEYRKQAFWHEEVLKVIDDFGIDAVCPDEVLDKLPGFFGEIPTADKMIFIPADNRIPMDN